MTSFPGCLFLRQCIISLQIDVIHIQDHKHCICTRMQTYMTVCMHVHECICFIYCSGCAVIRWMYECGNRSEPTKCLVFVSSWFEALDNSLCISVWESDQSNFVLWMCVFLCVSVCGCVLLWFMIKCLFVRACVRACVCVCVRSYS